MYIPSPEGNFMRIRFQGMFLLSINFFQKLHTSLHLVKLWLSNSSKICSPIWGTPILIICSILVIIWRNMQEFVLNYKQSARNLACSCRRRGENCLVPLPYSHSLPYPSGYTQRMQHVLLVNVVATTWPYSCLVLAAGGSVTGGQRNNGSSMILPLIYLEFSGNLVYLKTFFLYWFEQDDI